MNSSRPSSSKPGIRPDIKVQMSEPQNAETPRDRPSLVPSMPESRRNSFRKSTISKIAKTPEGPVTPNSVSRNSILGLFPVEPSNGVHSACGKVGIPIFDQYCLVPSIFQKTPQKKERLSFRRASKEVSDKDKDEIAQLIRFETEVNSEGTKPTLRRLAVKLSRAMVLFKKIQSGRVSLENVREHDLIEVSRCGRSVYNYV